MEAAKITIHQSGTESLQWPGDNLTGKIMQLVAGLAHTMPFTQVWIQTPSEGKHIIRTFLSSQKAGSTQMTVLHGSKQTTIFCL